MFLFPLGLAAKTKRFPIACVAILIGTSVYSFSKFDASHEAEKRLLTSQSTHEVYRARAALAIAACDRTELTPQDCEFLKTTLDISKPQHPNTLAHELALGIAEEYGENPLAEAKSKEFAALLFKEDFWKANEARVSDLPEHDAYQSALATFEDDRLIDQKAAHQLSKLNFNWRSLLEAQLTHAGWMHLIGNMLFFLILGIPVAERIGTLAFVGIYALSGIVGLSFQIAMFDSNVKGLVGASANVSGIAGLFLALFWWSKMRIWISAFFVWNRVLLVPSWVFIPLFVVMSDITGTIESGSNVAHLAHLGGFACGLATGFLWLKRYPLPKGFIFPFELELAQKAKKIEGEERLIPLAQILFYHPDNVEAQNQLMNTMIAQGEGSWRIGMKPSRVQRFLQAHFCGIFNRKLDEETIDSFLNFVSRLPKDWPLHDLTSDVDIAKLRSAITHVENSDPAVAVRLLRILMNSMIAESDRRLIEAKIQDLHQQQRAPHATGS